MTNDRPDEISFQEAAALARQIAKRFGKPDLIVSVGTIRSQAHIFRHLFVFYYSQTGRQKVKGVRLKAWQNHVEGRLALGRPIFGTDGYED